MTEFMTTKELAKVLRISMRTVYELCNSKGFPVIKAGTHYRIPKDDFELWYKKQARA